jgi:hypothetical protein
MARDVVIDPDWSFEQAFLVARQAHPGSRVGSKAGRHRVLKDWASAVGRGRARRELAAYLGLFPSKRAAAAAMGISADTFRRLEAHFASVGRLDQAGLTLGFDSRLHRFDPTAFDAFIAQVLGPETDVTIVQRSAIGAEGPGFLHLTGRDPEELLRVAEAFYERAWVQVQQTELSRAMSSGFAALLGRLEAQRRSLVSVQADLEVLRDPDVVEMWADQGDAWLLAKDKKLLQTRAQRLGEAVAREARRRTVGQLADTVQGEIFGALDDD